MFVRVTDSERADLIAEAKAAGMEVGAYARMMALAEPTTRRGDAHVTSRSYSVPFRVNDEERTRISELADRAGLTAGSYVRARALKRPVTLTSRRPPVDRTELARLLGLVQRVGSNLHQLTKHLNFGRDVHPVDVAEAVAEIADAAKDIRRSLGLKVPGTSTT